MLRDDPAASSGAFDLRQRNNEHRERLRDHVADQERADVSRRPEPGGNLGFVALPHHGARYARRVHGRAH